MSSLSDTERLCSVVEKLTDKCEDLHARVKKLERCDDGFDKLMRFALSWICGAVAIMFMSAAYVGAERAKHECQCQEQPK